METSLMVHDYPEPPEDKAKEVRARVTITYIVEGEVPEEWDTLDIESDIKQNFDDYNIRKEEIDDIEIL